MSEWSFSYEVEDKKDKIFYDLIGCPNMEADFKEKKHCR